VNVEDMSPRMSLEECLVYALGLGLQLNSLDNPGENTCQPKQTEGIRFGAEVETFLSDGS